MRTLPADALSLRLRALLVAAVELQARLEAIYRDKRGREADAYIDVLIGRLAQIYSEAGGRPRVYYDPYERENKFINFLVAVTDEVLELYAPDVVGDEGRRKQLSNALKQSALRERALMVLLPSASPRRAARARKYAAKRRASRR